MQEPAEDRLLSSSRREALFCLATWCAAAIYTIVYCALHGYGRSLDEMQFVLGFPDWVFWGVLTPWSVCLVLSIWFACRFMTDEDLDS